jgi:cytoskeletal protein RodZ
LLLEFCIGFIGLRFFIEIEEVSADKDLVLFFRGDYRMKFLMVASLLGLLACNQAKQEPIKAKSAKVSASADDNASSSSDSSSSDTATGTDDSSDSSSASTASSSSSSNSTKTSGSSATEKANEVIGTVAGKAKELTAAFDLLKKAAAANISCDSVADCTILPYGAKPCGGPEGYLVLSKKNAQVASGVVATLAAGYATLSATIASQTGTAGTCSLELPPIPACEAKLCVKK